MLKKYLFAWLFAGIIAVSPLSAANVSFVILETARPGGASGSQYSALWENTLMDVFFESGHIVSNSPVLQIVEKPADGFPDEAEKDFDIAKTGGMDYFIVTVVDYSLPYVSLRLFSTSNSSKMIREQKHTVKTFRNTKEEQENIKAAIIAIAAHLN